MSNPSTLLPVFPESSHLRVQASSKLAFGATTAALVTLASGGTALLVNHGTTAMTTATSLPSGSLLRDAASAAGPVVVDRAPGTFAEPAPANTDQTERALRAALADRPPVGRRTLTAPLVLLHEVTVPAPVVQVPPVVVPAVQVPAAVPGVHVPHTPHVPSVPDAHPTTDKPARPAKPTKPSEAEHEHGDNGKHQGRKHEESRVGEQDRVSGKHARAGRHAR